MSPLSRSQSEVPLFGPTIDQCLPPAGFRRPQREAVIGLQPRRSFRLAIIWFNSNAMNMRWKPSFVKRAVVASIVVAFAAGFAPSAAADVITNWNNAALNAIRAANTPPPVASRALAILHVSMFDAVNGISRRYEPFFVRSAAPASASQQAAASAAAHVVLVALFPAYSAVFDALHAATLAAVGSGAQTNMGIAWGEAVATAVLVWRANDGYDAQVPPPAGAGLGFWIPTPPGFAPYLLPQWAFVAPFAMPASPAFRPSGPPAVDSAKYAADFNEVKSLGAAVGSNRTAEQTTIALFWADATGTETPPGHWNSIAQEIVMHFGNTVEQNARLFALLNVAMADAAICAWDAKYAYDNWRPVTAIRNAERDGNPATTSDPAWNSFIVTPPFPDYVSGHATFSGAAATVLARLYGTDHIAFTVGSDFLPHVMRQFPSFSAAAAEAADSRVYAGIHFRSASEDGLAAGVEIGEWVYEHFMQTKDNRSRK